MARGCRGVPDHSDVFLSYSRSDGEAAINLRGQLQRCGLYVFKDDERIRAGELWLDRLQEAVGVAVPSSCWWGATESGAGSAPRRKWP